MSFLFSAQPMSKVERTNVTLLGEPLLAKGPDVIEKHVVVAESKGTKNSLPWGDYKEGDVLLPTIISSVPQWVKSQILPEIPSDFNMSVPRKERNQSTNLFLSKLVYLIPGLYTPTVPFSKGKSNGMGRKRKGKGKGKRSGKPRSLTTAMTVKDGATWSILSGTVPATKIGRGLNNKPYSVVQSVTFGTVLSTSAVAATFGAVGFTLAQIDQVATFTALFDQYRLARIELWMIPQYPTSLNTEWTSVLDFDDANNVGSYAAADDYMNAVTTTLNDGQYRCLTPHVAVAAYSGAFTSFANETAPWIDCSSTGVVHYGVKLAAVTAVSATTIVARARFHVQFRNIR